MKAHSTITRVFAIMLAVAMIFVLSGCEDNGTWEDEQATIKNAETLQEKQPTPQDIEYSLQRYNLIRRAYWINGMREKARTLPCEVEKPLGYIYFFLEGVGCVASYTVDGQITPLRTYLTPDTTYPDGGVWLADVDGTYGENQDGIFFFTVDGNYIEWNGKYQYSDILYEIDDPVLKTKEVD